MSGILNVLGMAVAFAAFYIILVQVNYDLNFNKGIKDSDKVFVITSGDFVGIGERTLVFNRPLAEMIIETSPNIEYGGIMNISNTQSSRYWLTVSMPNAWHAVPLIEVIPKKSMSFLCSSPVSQ